MPVKPGARLGPYEILAPLGAGGMGEVYRARDPRLGREVAIKVLPEDSTTDPERLRRFEQEAKAVGALNHPNLLTVFDTGQHEGAPFVVFELLEGETLRARLAGKALAPPKALEYAIQIARGLAAAHEKGIVHRDLKPENLFLTRDGRIKVLDFGLAKLRPPLDPGEVGVETSTASVLTDAGKVLGTVGYMSPEQVRRSPVDHRSDIFSFGSVLYEMLAGKRAFRGETQAETMTAILNVDPPLLAEANGKVPVPFERIVRHCLEKRPGDRFQSARDLVFDLESVDAAANAFSGSRAPLFAAGAVLVLVGLGLGVMFLRPRGGSEPPPGSAAPSPGAPVASPSAASQVRLRLEPAGPLATVTVASAYPLDVSWRGRVLARGEVSPRVSVPGGRQVLSVASAAHFLRADIVVNVAPGGQASVDAPALGRVSVRANPDNCQVFIDGTFVDYPPILDKPVSSGSHTVSFKWPDGKEARETVDVQGGKVAFVVGRKE